MSDYETGTVIEKIEALSPEEAVNQHVEDAVRGWIQTEYKGRMQQLAKGFVHRTEAGTKGFVETDNLLSRGLWAVREAAVAEFNRTKDVQTIDGIDRALKQDLFDSKDAVVNVPDGRARSQLHLQIEGSISTVTCIGLLRSARRDLRDSLELTDMVASTTDDMENAVDLMVYFGDKNPYADNAEVVRLVQLKSSGKADFGIWRLDRQTPDKDPSKALKPGDTKRMHRYSAELEARSEKPIDVQAYVITVPSHSDSRIGNVLGIIAGDKRESRGEIIEGFAQQAEKVGFFPKKKE